MAQVETLLKAQMRRSRALIKQLVGAVRLGAWGGAEDLARLDADQADDQTEAALAAFGLRRQ